jgi:hypothetical protein
MSHSPDQEVDPMPLQWSYPPVAVQQGTTRKNARCSIVQKDYTDAGTAGNWQVRVAFVGLTGTLNFRAEKRTP